MVKSGDMISGFCYYSVEFWGGPAWDLRKHGGTTVAEVVIQSVFGNAAKTKITFKEISLERANAIIPNVADIDSASLNDLGLTPTVSGARSPSASVSDNGGAGPQEIKLSGAGT